MLQLLQVGPAAQKILLQYLGDQPIKNHVIIPLGGVGDERAVAPIIHSMAEKGENPDQKRLNLIANLALTNITVAEVIWHHGGGIPIEACPDDPAACWSAWWERNRGTFRVKDIKVSRRYSNYPNYGIYRGLP